MKQNLFSKVAILFITGVILLACQRQTPYYIDAKTPAGLKRLLSYTGHNIYFLSAHRGGPELNYPENCIATFEHTLRYCYAMLEIDPRYTKDSVIIVHHDETLDRTTTGQGRVADFTFDELKHLKLKDLKGTPTHYPIQTLDEMLEWAKGKTILILDKKDVSIEERVRQITKHHAEASTVVMAYTFEEAQACYRLNPHIMMEVFIRNDEEIARFELTGIPWENVVVFIGHQKPDDMSVCRKLHNKKVLCIMGTSRNLDREYIEGRVDDMRSLKAEYHSLYDQGIDILETDIPVPLSGIINQKIYSSN